MLGRELIYKWMFQNSLLTTGNSWRTICPLSTIRTIYTFGVIIMLKKITTADARKKFANIINQVAFGNESFVLTRRGETVAAIISMKDLKLLQDLEDRIDIEDAWKAKNEPGEPISWEELKKELAL